MIAPAPVRARATLARGALVFRWGALVWMAALAATEPDGFRRPELAWAAIGAAGAWTAWLTVPRRGDRATALWFDLALAAALVLVSGLVVEEGDVVSGRPFFAAAYPASAMLSWGVAYGAAGGLVSGAILAGALALSRPVNGVALTDLPGRQIQSLANAGVLYLLSGAAVGVVSRLLVRSAEAVQRATDELVRERERAARLAERESLARRIHDSVLQALALVHKRGREIAASGSPSIARVAELAELAGQQEATLRSLILREPEEAPAGLVSLRESLEAVALGVTGVPVSVSAVGPIWLSRRRADEIAAAVREALANVVEHADASRASVFADEEGGEVVVTVRDDGVGFLFDEERLRAGDKVGVLKSMKGRIEEMGGRMTIEPAAGGGTEVEFRVPIP